ncbi:MAG: sigma-54-dependent Fis family transcriptional regulator [Nitrospiraceae bacterium]|nr:MAG: sigma-54-dependent Fis family transcriptional regulator [Nitrospiraceae bacterium]
MSETTKSILVVDDDAQMRAALRESVLRMGYHAEVAENAIDALKRLDETPVSMIVTDMKMPRMDGLSFIREARKKIGNLPILVITGYATVENAVDVMKEGVCDYLIKPFSFEDLTNTIEAILSRDVSGRDIITDDEGMKGLMQLAGSVASSDMTVLILGESGTGKEMLARYIHKSSRRGKKALIAVNCAAIPDNLLESELFGFEKGSFTGALEKKTGKFEQAHGGTILLDEIGEMSATLQAKLLRVLQEKEIDRIGAKQPVPVNVRVIATTNRDLKKEMFEGRFREDLYFRLNVFPLHLPPLRERPHDIELLAAHFAGRFSRELNKRVQGFTGDALAFLKSRPWKGNIRELENAIHRAVLIARYEQIDADDFMLEDQAAEPTTSNGSIRDMEMDLIMKTLEDTGGNKSRAAKLLGVSARTIRNKLNAQGKNFPVAGQE